MPLWSHCRVLQSIHMSTQGTTHTTAHADALHSVTRGDASDDKLRVMAAPVRTCVSLPDHAFHGGW